MEAKMQLLTYWLLAAALGGSAPAASQESYSPNVGESHPVNVYWGDTHLHTILSGDAYALGNKRPVDCNN